MKKIKNIALATIAIGFLIAFAMPQNTDAYTWYTSRESITIPSYNVSLGWINGTWYYGSWVSGAGENLTGNWSMPTPLNESTELKFYIYNNGTGPIHCNLTVNGNHRLNNSTTINAGVEFSLGFDESLYPQDYLNFTFNCDSTDVFVNVTIKWVNALVTKTTFITGNLGIIKSIKERYKTHPEIEFDRADSHYAVEDKILVQAPQLQDTANFTMEIYDVNLTIHYPDHAINKPVTKVYIDYLNLTSPAETHYIGYQKKGPYVYSIGTPSKNSFGDYELGMRIKAYEDEKDCEWDFNPESSDLSEYFPQIDYDSLVIKIDGKTVDFNVSSIHIDEIDLDSGMIGICMEE